MADIFFFRFFRFFFLFAFGPLPGCSRVLVFLSFKPTHPVRTCSLGGSVLHQTSPFAARSVRLSLSSPRARARSCTPLCSGLLSPLLGSPSPVGVFPFDDHIKTPDASSTVRYVFRSRLPFASHSLVRVRITFGYYYYSSTPRALDKCQPVNNFTHSTVLVVVYRLNTLFTFTALKVTPTQRLAL